jgi:capsular polysaccharide biosynthesis protein
MNRDEKSHRMTDANGWVFVRLPLSNRVKRVFMDNTERNVNDYYVVDLSHVIKVVWRNVWVVALVSIIVAALGFSLAAFIIAPTYSSSIMLYVNNSSFNVGDLGFSISSSELTAAQNLAKTYTVLLKNRTTLERIIDETGVDYTWEDVYDMIESSPVNETEVMQVTVTCTDPYEAEKIANGIAKILPQRIAEIIEGSSMEVVDSAIVNTEKVAPSITAYTIVGFIVGAILAALVLVISALMDNTVHDEEYVIKTYNYPILAKVPNLLDSGTKKYGYYYSYKSRSNKEGR